VIGSRKEGRGPRTDLGRGIQSSKVLFPENRIGKAKRGSKRKGGKSTRTSKGKNEANSLTEKGGKSRYPLSYQKMVERSRSTRLSDKEEKSLSYLIILTRDGVQHRRGVLVIVKGSSFRETVASSGGKRKKENSSPSLGTRPLKINLELQTRAPRGASWGNF